MRGDRPSVKGVTVNELKATPHARGSTPITVDDKGKIAGYPACAGIDPSSTTKSIATLRLPRMRGDRPPTDHSK